MRFNAGELEVWQTHQTLLADAEDDGVEADVPEWMLAEYPTMEVRRVWEMKPTAPDARERVLELAELSLEHADQWPSVVQVEEVLRHGVRPGADEEGATTLLRLVMDESYTLPQVHATDWGAVARRTHALSRAVAQVATGTTVTPATLP